MDSEELVQEVEAIEAIFDGCVEKLAPGIVSIQVPNHPDFAAQLAFPTNYPDEMPSLIQVVTRNAMKYPDNEYLFERIQELLEKVFVPSEVIMFELIGEVVTFLDAYEEERQQAASAQKNEAPQDTLQEKPKANLTVADPAGNVSTKDHDFTKDWVQSEPIVDRALTFLAFAREVHSTAEAWECISLLTSDRKIAKAAHNMVAMRIFGENGVSYQDCDDDGETAAGLRMLHLLTVRISQQAVQSQQL